MRTNTAEKIDFLQKFRRILLSLTTEQGEKRLCDTPRGMGIIGFLVDISSLVGLANELLLANNFPVRYLLGYKFSQDHLKLFFQLFA